jgi:penicillin-binding protein 1A
MRSFVGRFSVILITLALALAVAVAMGFAGAYQFLRAELPDARTLRDVRVQLPLQVYSRDGKLIAQIGEQRRIPIALDDAPQPLIDAFLAAEDARFYSHPGVDWQGLVRALVSNLSAGGVREGGGTITMQLARNTFLTPERTLRRKLKEVFLALRIERQFEKREILELYLNRIFLGQRAYGVGAAAEVYFGKPVGALTLAESALIAGLPRSPSLDNPVASQERARARREHVLERMLATGTIDRAQYAGANAEPIPTRRFGRPIEIDAGYVAEMARLEMLERFGPAALFDGYRVTTTIEAPLQLAADAAVRRAMLEYERRHGWRGPLERLGPAADAAAIADGFKRQRDLGELRVALVTAVEPQAVRLRDRGGAELAIAWEGLSWARPALDDALVGPAPKTAGEIVAVGDLVLVEALADGAWRLAPKPVVGGALVALRPQDGSIAALSGGFDFDESNYNRAVQAQRQPGSAFKPFLYSAALEKGYTAATLINDAPIVIQGASPAEDWRPQNISKRFYGPTRLREGLVRSRNLVSIRLLRGIGTGFATRHIQGFGFGAEALPANLTLALGTGQTTPIQMARGFAAFANGGFRVEPYLIESVLDADGKRVFAAAPRLACLDCLLDPPTAADATLDGSGAGPAPAAIPATPEAAPPRRDLPPVERRAPQAISPANAYVMTDIMREVITRGTAQLANTLGRDDLAGKTGTTSDRRDTWFVGFNGDLATAAWIGFDQERTLGEQEEGGRTALPMWVYFMRVALEGRPSNRLAEPPGIVRMWVSRSTGQPASVGSPGAVSEVFLERYAPLAGNFIYMEDDAAAAEAVTPEDAGDDSLF